jgi:hypothetical protein
MRHEWDTRAGKQQVFVDGSIEVIGGPLLEEKAKA